MLAMYIFWLMMLLSQMHFCKSTLYSVSSVSAIDSVAYAPQIDLQIYHLLECEMVSDN